MGKKDEKTNVMRILEQKKIPYNSYNYLSTGAISGVEVAQALGEDPDIVFKTLVTVGKSKEHYVFVIPVEKELNLKKAAKSVGEKSIEMIKQKELLPLTGYVHGGCSPIGMKKQFTTTIDKSAGEHEKIIFSAGKIGYQVEVALDDLEKVVRFKLAEVAEGNKIERIFNFYKNSKRNSGFLFRNCYNQSKYIRFAGVCLGSGLVFMMT